MGRPAKKIMFGMARPGYFCIPFYIPKIESGIQINRARIEVKYNHKYKQNTNK